MNTEQRMSALENRLRAAEDHLAIMNLLASYGPLVDSGNADATAALWAEDGEYDVPGLHMKSRDEIRAMVQSESHRTLIMSGSTHFIGPAHVSIDGDRAHAVCESVLVLKESSSYRILMSGSHSITLARIDGRWRITHRVTRELNGDSHARDLLEI